MRGPYTHAVRAPGESRGLRLIPKTGMGLGRARGLGPAGRSASRYHVDQTQELYRYIQSMCTGEGLRRPPAPPLAEGNPGLGTRQVCELMFDLLWRPSGVSDSRLRQTWPNTTVYLTRGGGFDTLAIRTVCWVCPGSSLKHTGPCLSLHHQCSGAPVDKTEGSGR